MPDKEPPRDPNQLAKYILDVLRGETDKIEPRKKDLAIVALGRRGGQASAKTTQRETLVFQAPRDHQASG